MLGEILGVPEENVATIGDMPNDILMFERSGTSIAMGQASDEVKRAARFVTASNQEDGFALAIERYVLAHSVGQADGGEQAGAGGVPSAPAGGYQS